MVLLTFGLLSPGKGIEHVICALPAILAKHPNVVYVVLGATHPHVLKHEGEAYRNRLKEMAKIARCGGRRALLQPVRVARRPEGIHRRGGHLHHALSQRRADHQRHAGVQLRRGQGRHLHAVLARGGTPRRRPRRARAVLRSRRDRGGGGRHAHQRGAPPPDAQKRVPARARHDLVRRRRRNTWPASPAPAPTAPASRARVLRWRSSTSTPERCRR